MVQNHLREPGGVPLREAAECYCCDRELVRVYTEAVEARALLDEVKGEAQELLLLRVGAEINRRAAAAAPPNVLLRPELIERYSFCPRQEATEDQQRRVYLEDRAERRVLAENAIAAARSLLLSDLRDRLSGGELVGIGLFVPANGLPDDDLKPVPGRWWSELPWRLPELTTDVEFDHGNGRLLVKNVLIYRVPPDPSPPLSYNGLPEELTALKFDGYLGVVWEWCKDHLDEIDANLSPSALASRISTETNVPQQTARNYISKTAGLRPHIDRLILAKRPPLARD